MMSRPVFALLFGACCSMGIVEPAAAQGAGIDSVQAGLRRLTARLEALEAGSCPSAPLVLPRIPPGSPGLDSLAAGLARLAARIDLVTVARCQVAGRPVTADTVVDELAALRAAAEAAVSAAQPEGAVAPSDTQFVSRQRNLSAFNPEISATGDLRFVGREGAAPRDHAQLSEVELSFQSALDPYSHTKLFLTFGEEEIGVEEGYIYYTGLPGRLRVDAGKFRQAIGDLNRWHAHALPQSEYPLVYRRFLGDEGLAGVGVSLYTALPVALAGGTHEVWFQATSAESEPLYANSRQPTFLGRLQNFWQLSRSTYLQLGATATGGNAASEELASRLIGADLRFTWRPPASGTRQDVTIRAEGYRLRTTQAGVRTTRHGGFVDAQVKAGPRWVLGMRYDNSEAPGGDPDAEWAIVPTLSWWQSEFVRLRLEASRHQTALGARNQIALQVVWAMGPHKHEVF